MLKSASSEKTPGYGYMYQYLPYVLISILCYVMGLIMIAFHQPDLQKANPLLGCVHQKPEPAALHWDIWQSDAPSGCYNMDPCFLLFTGKHSSSRQRCHIIC